MDVNIAPFWSIFGIHPSVYSRVNPIGLCIAIALQIDLSVDVYMEALLSIFGMHPSVKSRVNPLALCIALSIGLSVFVSIELVLLIFGVDPFSDLGTRFVDVRRLFTCQSSCKCTCSSSCYARSALRSPSGSRCKSTSSPYGWRCKSTCQWTSTWNRFRRLRFFGVDPSVNSRVNPIALCIAL